MNSAVTCCGSSVNIRATTSAPAQLMVDNGRGQTINVGLSPSSPGFTPLELQASALAACIAASVRIAARNAGVEKLGGVEVDLRATKAEDAPSRLARFEFSVAFSDDLDPQLQSKLIEDAERICTISNTLRSDPPVVISHRVDAKV